MPTTKRTRSQNTKTVSTPSSPITKKPSSTPSSTTTTKPSSSPSSPLPSNADSPLSTPPSSPPNTAPTPPPARADLDSDTTTSAPPAKRAKTSATPKRKRTSAAAKASWTAQEDDLIWRLKTVEKKSNKEIALALGGSRTAKSVEHRIGGLKDLKYEWDEEQIDGIRKAVEEYNAQSAVDRYLAVTERAIRAVRVVGKEKVSKMAVVAKVKAMEAAGECGKIREK